MEKEMRFKVRDGIGVVEVHCGPYDRRFEPGNDYSATEQEWSLYLRNVESLEVLTDGPARGREDAAFDTGEKE